MWCPKCKNEYQDGITVCADCKVDLVESLEKEDVTNICEISKESIAKEVVEFFEYSGIEDVVMTELEDSHNFRITVPSKYAEKADKIFSGYILAKEEEFDEVKEEYENVDNEEAEEIIEKVEEEVVEDTKELIHSKTDFQTKADKCKDMKFTAITFVLFAIAGAVYLTLSKLEIIPISYNNIVFCAIAALFVIFFVIGVIYGVKSIKMKKELPAERELIDSINTWLEENIDNDKLDSWEDSEITDMENDLLYVEKINEELKKQFPDENIGMLEFLADKFYEEKFL